MTEQRRRALKKIEAAIEQETHRQGRLCPAPISISGSASAMSITPRARHHD